MEKNENGYSEYRLGGRGNGWSNGQPQRQNGNRQDGCGSQGNIAQNGCGNGEGCEGCNGAGRHLAMVYSPYQCWRMLYTPSDALKHGTLFEELYKPVGECKNG